MFRKGGAFGGTMKSSDMLCYGSDSNVDHKKRIVILDTMGVLRTAI